MSVETLRQLGDDALQNLWDMSIGPIPFLPNVASSVIRIQNFTIPGTGANTYEVHYKSQRITKIGGKVDSPKEFSFDIRIDRNWAIYKGFVAWKNAAVDTASGLIAPDGPNAAHRTDVSVWATDGTGLKPEAFGTWQFRGAFVQNVGDVSLDYTGGDPITVSITMGFAVLDDSLL